VAPDLSGKGIDFGNSMGPDFGRNILRAPDAGSSSNPGGAICMVASSPGSGPMYGPFLAAGNIFGSTDCITGGVLTRSPECTGGVDLGGFDPKDWTSFDVSGCQ
jgi:hypothetical protein